ncbi:exodeoxyribonuclease VII small subunit [Ruminococcus sp.]|uniref:exodeoxyribonuclease VII small subunit n=1 Tax=Ruminococcus sp. TaxID=41978 RepID=UPI00388FD4F6
MTQTYDKMDFEAAYQALREVVTKLENPQNKIEENIALYEEACKLVLHCRRKLDEAKQQITDINERIAQMKESGEEVS